MGALATLVFAGAVVGGGYQLFQLFAAWWFLRRARRRTAGPTGARLPPATILKPLKGVGLELYENLATFCRQDHPDYEIILGVDDPQDPALAVARRIVRDFPERRIVVSIADEPGTNRKVANLVHMTRRARHDVLVLSDADVRVRPDYLRAMVAPLAAAKEGSPVGLTTCLYRGVGRAGPASVLESLFVNAEFIPMVLVAHLVQRLRYAYGASIAITREALGRIGGFEALTDHLADDYWLGRLVTRAGYRLRLLPHVVETVLDAATLGTVWQHQLRWARTYRACQPPGWFLSIMTNATLMGTIALGTIGGLAGLATFGAAVGTRLLSLAGILALLGDRDTLRRLWLVPVRDLLGSVLWAASFLGHRVVWGGRLLAVDRDGRMRPVPAEVLDAEPARLAAGSAR